MKRGKTIHWKKNLDAKFTGCGQEIMPLKQGGVIWSYEKVKTTCEACKDSRRIKR